MNSRITVHHLLLSNLLKLTQAHHLDQSALEESMDRIEHHLENMNVHFFSNFLAGNFGPNGGLGLLLGNRKTKGNLECNTLNSNLEIEN